MQIQSTRRLFKPKFSVKPGEVGKRARVVNTTGDWIDPESSVVVPKKGAQIGKNSENQEFLRVEHQGKEHWIPKENFQSLDDQDGVYYLPTYKDSPKQGAIGGASKALVALGPLGAVSGGVAGFAAHRLGKTTPLKIAIGAGVGAATLGVANTALFGPAGLPVSLLFGAAAGVASVHAGEGEAEVRDASYGGSIAGYAVGAMTGNPLTLLTASAAAGLGARAKNPLVKALVGGAVGAALGAAQAALTGQPIALVAGLTAAAGAAGPIIGTPVMQLTRNLSHHGGKVVSKALRNAPDPVLKVVGSVPYAAGMGFMGAMVGSLIPGGTMIGAAIGTTGGALTGYMKMSKHMSADAQAASQS